MPPKKESKENNQYYPNYYYNDGDIDRYIGSNVRSNLGGYEIASSPSEQFFRHAFLKLRFGGYKVAIIPAIDSSSRQSPISTSLGSLLPYITNDDLPLKILLPYNIGDNSHWLTGEIIINAKNDNDKFVVQCTAHDPLHPVNSSFSDDIMKQIKNSFARNFSDARAGAILIRNRDVVFENYYSPYVTKRQNDGSSCGLIASRDIIQRAMGRDLVTIYEPNSPKERKSDLRLGYVNAQNVMMGVDHYVNQNDLRMVDDEELDNLYAQALKMHYDQPGLSLDLFARDYGDGDGEYIRKIREGIGDEFYNLFFSADGRLLVAVDLFNNLGKIYQQELEESLIASDLDVAIPSLSPGEPLSTQKLIGLRCGVALNALNHFNGIDVIWESVLGDIGHLNFEILASYYEKKIEEVNEVVNRSEDSNDFFCPEKYKGIGVDANYEYDEASNSWQFTVTKVFEGSQAQKYRIEEGSVIKMSAGDGMGSEDSLKEVIKRIRNGEIETLNNKPFDSKFSNGDYLLNNTRVFERNKDRVDYHLYKFTDKDIKNDDLSWVVVTQQQNSGR